MTAIKLVCAAVAAIPLAMLTFGHAAFAQQFSGQVVTMVVNFSAGGPTDVEARLAARHLPKYLQGVRSIVVRNVGGGGGVIAVNQLGEASERDRLNVGFFTWGPLAQLIQDESLRVRYNDLKFIIGFRQLSLIYIRRDTPPGINRPSDVVKAPMIKAGALGPISLATIRQRLALDLLGAKYETIAGYKGLSDIELAVRRGDLQLAANSLPGWYSSVKPNLVDTGIVVPLFQYDYERADGTTGRNPDLPEVPAFSEVFKEVMGPAAVPGGELSHALQLLTRIVDIMYRTVFMPPNAPAAAVEEMRGAFEKLATDAEFIADYEKVVRTKPHFVIGAQGDAVISELGKVQPSFVSFLRRYIDAAR
jgi:tripartite-type tricarboxylate transporter receptor subunit TctC